MNMHAEDTRTLYASCNILLYYSFHLRAQGLSKLSFVGEAFILFQIIFSTGLYF
jgi:hypothetical protein